MCQDKSKTNIELEAELTELTDTYKDAAKNLFTRQEQLIGMTADRNTQKKRADAAVAYLKKTMPHWNAKGKKGEGE